MCFISAEGRAIPRPPLYTHGYFVLHSFLYDLMTNDILTLVICINNRTFWHFLPMGLFYSYLIDLAGCICEMR